MQFHFIPRHQISRNTVCTPLRANVATFSLSDFGRRLIVFGEEFRSRFPEVKFLLCSKKTRELQGVTSSQQVTL